MKLFTIYADKLHALDDLPLQDYATVVKALVVYQETGVKMTVENPVAAMALRLLLIDCDCMRSNACTSRADAGKRGANKRWGNDVAPTKANEVSADLPKASADLVGANEDLVGASEDILQEVEDLVVANDDILDENAHLVGANDDIEEANEEICTHLVGVNDENVPHLVGASCNLVGANGKVQQKNSKSIANYSKVQQNSINIKEQERKECVSNARTRKPTPTNPGRIIPPTMQMVNAYCDEKGYDRARALKFYNFYGSKDWRVGRDKMKNWHCSIANWMSGQDYGAHYTSPPKQRQDDDPYGGYERL